MANDSPLGDPNFLWEVESEEADAELPLDDPEFVWGVASAHVDVEVQRARDIAAELRYLPEHQQYNGVKFLVRQPEAVLLVQKMHLTPQYLCAHCGTNHPILIIQTINVRHQQKGHGTRLLREMIEDAPHGIKLQALMGEPSKKLAKRLGMTPRDYNPDDVELCDFKKKPKVLDA